MEPMQATTRDGVRGDRSRHLWEPMELRYVGDVSELVRAGQNKSILHISDTDNRKQNNQQ